MEKRYDHITSEDAVQKKWASENTYQLHSDERPLYSIDTPPPTVSGALHIGHIFSYTQADVIARYKRMAGFRVFYPFGFDDNGLPTERYVEKKRKVRAHLLKRSEFIALCLEESKLAEKEFISLWKRIGLSADWSRVYSTISGRSRRISQESFLKLLAKELVYRRNEPALYCTACRTSVAQAELDDKECPSHFNDIIFKGNDGSDLTIGTTRPELLSSCVALFFHPTDTRYHHLRGTHATVPIFGHSVPILEDDTVDPEKGTGLVMCCTFGDKADVAWYKMHNLPYRQSIGFDGKWIESTGILAGMKAHDARKRILEELAVNNLLTNQRKITHAVNVHERCKNEIEFVVLRQWFVDILKDKQRYLDLADEIEWNPPFMKARYIDWVKNLSWDWCISRQRFYGIPFPVWHCNDCNQVLPARPEHLPVDPQETTYPGKSCSQCNGSNIVPDTDVMDTWNTSALTPYLCASILNEEQNPLAAPTTDTFLPMSMRPQAHDIIRTWAFYTIIKSWMHHQRIPWKQIVISGHVLSGQKEKLSKSKGNNTLAPENLLSQYPADTIRYWASSGSLGQDTAFSQEQLKIGLRLITKLWNAFRFLKEHLQASSQQPSSLGTVNEWILHQASECFSRYQEQFEKHEFGAALDHAERFFWHDFCDNYLELIKNQLFNPNEYDSDEVEATRWTLSHIGLRILQLYAPYLPHLTETIHGLIYQEKSIHLTQFSDIQQVFVFPDSKSVMERVVQIVGTVRRLKSEHQLSLKTPLKSLKIHSNDAKDFAHIKQHEQLIKGITQAQSIDYIVGTPELSSLSQDGSSWNAAISLNQNP